MKKILSLVCLLQITLAQFSINKTILDQGIDSLLKDERFAALSILVLDKDSVLYRGRFGYADLENKKAIDQDKDVFRIASVSKLFTTIAVLQAVEKGYLDLDRDINAYLPFKIDYRFNKKISLKDLLTHSSGLEDIYLNTYALEKDKTEALNVFLETNFPEQIYAPAEKTLYSNFAFALAGYIVELQSKSDFFSYIEKNILEPLDMNSSFVSEEESFQKKVMKSYTYDRDLDRFLPFEKILYRNLSPAGMINATANDMIPIIQLLLKNETLLAKNILNERSIDELKRIHFRMNPELNGNALSLYERHIGKIRSLNIGGQLPSFSSHLAFIDKGPAIFLSANTAMSSQLIKILDKIVKLSFDTETKIQRSPVELKNPERYTDRYRWNKYNRHELTYIKGLYNDTKVLYYDEGYFRFYGSNQNWVYVNDTSFIASDSEEKLIFTKNENNKITGIKSNLIFGMPVYLERFKAIENPDFVNNAIGICLMIFILFPLIWGIGFIYRKIKKRAHDHKIRQSKRIFYINISLIILHFIALRYFLKNFMDFVTGNRLELQFFYAFSFLLTVGLLLQFKHMIVDLMTKDLTIYTRSSFIIILFSLTFYYFLLSYFNLIWFAI